MAESTVYLQFEPSWWSGRGLDGEPKLRGMSITKMFKRRPDKITGVLVKLKVKIPDKAFRPLQPTVVVDVPESAMDFQPTVSVELPEA